MLLFNGAVMEPLPTCPRCGSPVRPDALRCETCGARTIADTPPPWRVRAVVGVVLVVFLGAAIWGVSWVKGQWSSSPSTAGTVAGSTSSAPATGTSSAASPSPSAPEPGPSSTTPTSSVTAPRGARACDKGGDLEAYAGTPRTSCAFAITVRDAFVGAGGTTDGGSRSVRAHSTVTDTTYTVTCSGTDLVTCRGGDDAVIYLLP